MKLKDWYNFNFGNDQFKCNIGDIYVKVFRKESYKNEDVILEQLMKPDDMVYLFTSSIRKRKCLRQEFLSS